MKLRVALRIKGYPFGEVFVLILASDHGSLHHRNRQVVMIAKYDCKES